MRILLGTDCYYQFTSGVNIFTKKLAEKLKDLGHDVLIVAPSSSMDDERFDWDGIPTIGLRSFETFFYKSLRITPPLFMKRKIKKIVDEFQPDVIHLQTHFIIGAVLLDVAQKKQIPIVGTNHVTPENFLPHVPHLKQTEPIIRFMYWKFFKRKFKNVDLITTPTQSTADLVVQKGLEQEVVPISNGIDLSKFNPQVDGTWVREKYGLEGKKILLFVGRFDAEKNIDWAIRAMPQILQKESTAHLLIAGRGPKEKSLRKLIDEMQLNKHVTFAGFVEHKNLPLYYNAADLFLMPGTAETQSIVTMEAMACGLPVLAVNKLALPELVLPGQNGFLFEEGDIHALADFAVQMLQDQQLLKNMGKVSLDHVQKHDLQNVVKKFEDIYEKVLSVNFA